jgi:hypothetical protein
VLSSNREDQPRNAFARTILRKLTTNDTSGDQADQACQRSTSSTVAFHSNIQFRTRSGPTKHASSLLRRPSQRTEAATTNSWICRWYEQHPAYGEDTERRSPPLSNSMNADCEHHRYDAPVTQKGLVPGIKITRPRCNSAGQTAVQEP